MALHKDLPIYKLAYDLLCLSIDITQHMPREFKQSIGGRIREECLSVLVLVGRANVAKNKVPHLEALLEHQHAAELLIRVSHEKRFISTSLYARAIEMAARVGAQAGGWRNKSLSTAAASPVA